MACLNPYRDEKGAAFPCGRCPNCRKNRVRQWMFRLLQEEKQYEEAHFVTLTYDTRTVPITPKGFMSLRKKDLQDFWKRLRKAQPGTKIRYYVVGEYGPKTDRPHYHAVVFGSGADFIGPAWNLGEVHIGRVSGASVAYTAGYINKPGGKIPRGDWDDRAPQFSCMSKGLGASFLTPAVERFYLADITRNYVVQDGYKIGLPRYYRKKLPYTDEQREEMAEFAAMAFDEQEMAEYWRVLEQYPLKGFKEFQRERYEGKKRNEKFMNRKL